MNIDTPIGENGLQMNAVHEIHTLSGSLSLSPDVNVFVVMCSIAIKCKQIHNTFEEIFKSMG